MTPSFAIMIQPRRNLMRVTLKGFFALSDVAALDVERRVALIKLGCLPNDHVTMVDVSDCKLQSQEVVQAFQTMLGEPRYRSRRLAFVTGSSLVRMQVRRIMNSDTAHFFETAVEAQLWLFEHQASAIAA